LHKQVEYPPTKDSWAVATPVAGTAMAGEYIRHRCFDENNKGEFAPTQPNQVVRQAPVAAPVAAVPRRPAPVAAVPRRRRRAVSAAMQQMPCNWVFIARVTCDEDQLLSLGGHGRSVVACQRLTLKNASCGNQLLSNDHSCSCLKAGQVCKQRFTPFEMSLFENKGGKICSSQPTVTQAVSLTTASPAVVALTPPPPVNAAVPLAMTTTGKASAPSCIKGLLVINISIPLLSTTAEAMEEIAKEYAAAIVHAAKFYDQDQVQDFRGIPGTVTIISNEEGNTKIKFICHPNYGQSMTKIKDAISKASVVDELEAITRKIIPSVLHGGPLAVEAISVREFSGHLHDPIGMTTDLRHLTLVARTMN